MSYIGVSPSTAAFPFDQFSGNGSTTAFTMSYAPASTTSMVVCISGVVQNPNTYGISGLTLTFSAAPPTGTNNIAVLYLGIPATSVTTPGNSAYLSSTEFTATAGQTTFTPSGSYQVGFVNVIRNGAQLAPSDYTATNGTTVVLGSACAVGDAVVIEVYNLVSVANALPSTGGTVTGATTFNGASTFGSTVSINGANGSGYTGFKNRIINGEMDIDQRNAGAAVTHSGAANLYVLDRWVCNSTGTPQFSVQRVADAPAGFINSSKLTTTTAGTPAAGDFSYYGQYIEGFNVADLGFGTASAATVTISFWVKSSLTGTFGGTLKNGAVNRAYPFSYTISAANTWELKSVTIAGDTTGTWTTDNTIGMTVFFDTGSGVNNKGTAGAWNATANIGVTGGVNLVATASATWQVTGVQLERGSNATSFEFRDYGRELALCRRYFRKLTGTSATPLSCQGPLYLDANTIYFSYQADLNDMRAAPTAALVGTANTDYAVWNSPFAQQTGFTINAVAYTNFGGVQFQTTKSLHGLSNNPQIYFGTVTTTGALTLSSEL
jgi:hypothetical protein